VVSYHADLAVEAVEAVASTMTTNLGDMLLVVVEVEVQDFHLVKEELVVTVTVLMLLP
jgi:hypothetical protein